ncbi:MAG: bifunctional 5,10-methylenetetrahydrofolate dehydrogenase/5,10-methenyltetrahydrofolate cyclohydrolase [Nitrospiraceae bacterium]|nr:MAG: bifunctional 5,10-methylenetetrahydrofolate dehydrogenase/5,10-methenyltetrahydrofolate cyclohydrolase [Nitrospiraceae bacterium]
MANIMDGRRLSDEIKDKVKREVQKLSQYGINVGLGLLLVGENPASKQYLLATVKACKQAGILSFQYSLPGSASINEILNTVKTINSDERINGLLVLMPLPKKINTRRVVNEIVPEKDIDGLGSLSVGRLAADESTFQIFKQGNYDSLYTRESASSVSGFLPCTPFGVIRLIEYCGIEIKGKHAVVIGKSLAVGKPLSLMLLAKEATVTVCHKATEDLGYFTRQADILCTATGIKELIKGDMVKEGAVVVDIGINVLEDGSIVGDVDFESVSQKASFITPVPGGVGPVTMAMLLENTVRSAQSNQLFKHPLMMG